MHDTSTSTSTSTSSPGASTLPPTEGRECGRVFCAIWALTFVVQVLSLQVRGAVFGGTRWLSAVKYLETGERLGLLMVLLVFSLAAAGLWLVCAESLGRLLRRSPQRALRWGAATWLFLLLADAVVRHQVGALLGDAFDFMDFAGNVGGLRLMLQHLWTWYGAQILEQVGLLVLLTLGLVWLWRWLRRQDGWWAPADRLGGRGARRVTWVAVSLSLLFMTAGTPLWPVTRDLLARDTLLGLPFSTVIHWATDFDRDGYGLFGAPADTAPFDASRHPYALDIPNDGIDQDLLAGDLRPAHLPPDLLRWVDDMTFTPQATPLPRHVVWVVLESVRADMLAAEIDGQEVMPFTRALVSQGALQVPHFHATKGFTRASVTQAFWGSIFPPATTLMDDLADAGWHIAVFSAEDLRDEGFESALHLNRAQHVVDPRSLPHEVGRSRTIPARRLMGHVEAFIEGYAAPQPLFLYIYLQDPHFPYHQDNPLRLNDAYLTRREIHRGNREALWRAYCNQVFHLDLAMARLFAALDAAAMRDDTLVVLMGDHGESLFDDGVLLGHGIALDDVMTHALMVIHGARRHVPGTLSHHHLRRWLHEELSLPAVTAPRVVPMPERSLVQYLGPEGAPNRIALMRPEQERVVYDFRTGWVSQGESRVGLDGDDALAAEGRALVDAWALMQWRYRPR